MKTGNVKWFNPRKGFGFVRSEGKDYFVHYNNIDMTGYKKLGIGQKVEFELLEFGTQQQAANVKVYDDKCR
jgi:CspA family cold shock protein